ncbi:hypothetical protein [Nocardia huaxiensis]|uniref:hypothetical protein n=1 Tax=Nocardia huaxiensis TaxID=2755382 RepID=UPI001E61AB25|nr:hypothetical protein [Nocardia huaxiensis]UFS97325.1 hypothetical protein LPY97_05245 [Nocardia huaxiensis]
MSTPHAEARIVPIGRRLSYPMFAVVVIAYLDIIQGGGILMRHLTGEGDFFSTQGGVHGLTESRVALWSSLVFGFFYLIRRVTRGNTANSIIHGLFDFPLLTGTAILLLLNRHRIEPAQQ